MQESIAVSSESINRNKVVWVFRISNIVVDIISIVNFLFLERF